MGDVRPARRFDVVGCGLERRSEMWILRMDGSERERREESLKHTYFGQRRWAVS
jgi:hypothetical protein